MKIVALRAFPLLWAGLAYAQFEDFFNITAFPAEQKTNVTQYLSEARNLGDDIYPHFSHRCILNQVYPSLYNTRQANGFIAPREVLDGFYFVGQNAVSAWAYDTGDGLVVFDSLNNAEEAEHILIPGIESFGFSGSDIKHLVIMHEHFDHYGGARYIQDTYKAAIYASAPAWNGMTAAGNGPAVDKIVAEGDKVTFGNVTFTFYFTPGHTPGTISLVFPVYENGVEHTAGFFGGLGPPRDARQKEQHISSLRRFAGLANEAGVDTMITNHQLQDGSIYHFDLLEHRAHASEHPFIVGTDYFERFLEMNALCAKVLAARIGQNLAV